jgi:hypothetical protein
MEVQMEMEALEVLERLILEDDHSVEAWYLGGWCLYLLGEKEKNRSPSTNSDLCPAERRHESLIASREWLKQSLKLFEKIAYEDERLRDHAIELVQGLNKELGEDTESQSGAEDNGEAKVEDEADWEDEIQVDSDEDEDYEMKDS